MNKHSLITGAGGFLGPRICEYHSDRDGYETMGVAHRELNIGDFVAVFAFIKATRPDYVLHCVTTSSTGICERNPILPEKANVRGTVNLARVYGNVSSRMIFISSDQICNISHSVEPSHGGSGEEPGNMYGRDKKWAEGAMPTYLPDAMVLRLTWMCDAPSRGRAAGQGLLQKLADALKDRRGMESLVRGYRGITYVWEVVHHLEEAMGPPRGVYNFGSENRYDTFDTARLFLRESAEDDSGGILKCSNERLASHPRSLTMGTDKIKSYGIRFFNTSEGICRCCMERREMPRASC